MRTSKFRGQRVDNNELIYGDLTHSTTSFNGLKKNIVLIGCDYNFVEVIPETVGEFTSFTDKKGADIYEGQKVKHESFEKINITTNKRTKSHSIEYGVIIFKDGCFQIKWEEGINAWFGEYPHYDYLHACIDWIHLI